MTMIRVIGKKGNASKKSATGAADDVEKEKPVVGFLTDWAKHNRNNCNRSATMTTRKRVSRN